MERDHQTTLPVVLITWCLSVGSISRALAESQVIGSPQPIIVVAGGAILPCSLVPPISAEELTVEWSRPDLESKYVHVYRDGRNLVRDQNHSYRYRTSLFKEELINGNVSLKLSRVKLEDQGNYTCRIPSHKEAVIELIVVAVSEPKISILGTNITGVVLQCEAKRWYPELQLEWREGPKDSDGRLLSADVTQTDREPNSRYTVRSSVTVQKTDTNMFNCRVQLLKYNLTRETEIHVPGDKFPTGSFLPGWANDLIRVVVIFYVVVFTLNALFWCCCGRRDEHRQIIYQGRFQRTHVQRIDESATGVRPRNTQNNGRVSHHLKLSRTPRNRVRTSRTLNPESDRDSLASEVESNAGSDSGF